MKRALGLALVLTTALSLSACNTPQDANAARGAVIGGTTGALIGGLASGRPAGALAGGAIGAASGAILGAASTPPPPRVAYLPPPGYPVDAYPIDAYPPPTGCLSAGSGRRPGPGVRAMGHGCLWRARLPASCWLLN